MCTNFVSIKDGDTIQVKGIFRKGHYVICLECGIIKLNKKDLTKWKHIATINRKK